METVGFSFVLRKTYQFFKNNINLLIFYPFILLLLFFPISTLMYYHHQLKKIVCKFSYSEILIYSFSFFEILMSLPFLTLMFLMMIQIVDYATKKIEKENLNFDFSDFNIFKNVKNKLNIAFNLSIFLVVFFIIVIALQFLIFIILYLIYYYLSGGNIDKVYKILIYLLPLTFSILVIVLFVYLILPALRRLLTAENFSKLLNSLKLVFSLKFIRISFTYEYFVYWLEWLLVLVLFIAFTLFIKSVILNLLDNYLNEYIIYFINSFVNMFLLMVSIVYTAIYSIFVEDKLEVPAILEEEIE